MGGGANFGRGGDRLKKSPPKFSQIQPDLVVFEKIFRLRRFFRVFLLKDRMLSAEFGILAFG